MAIKNNGRVKRELFSKYIWARNGRELKLLFSRIVANPNIVHMARNVWVF